jgi:5'-3' exonuclease
MGVPKFVSWLYGTRARGLSVSNIPENVVSLSFDVNSIIHGCAQIVYGYGESENEFRKKAIQSMTDKELEEELFQLIMDTILRITVRVNPKNYLVLAIDGVAPLAKINQQRSRRYRAGGSSGSSQMRFDPNCITPGTDFMFRLDKYMQDWIQANQGKLPEKVLYSGHLVRGEGEQKIFDYIRSYEINGYGAHVLYGLDADLIILALISRLKGIYLIREKSLEPNVYEKLIRIDELRNYLQDRMGTETALDDFAVLSFFLGNDFLPTSPMFKGDMYQTIEYLLDVYVSLDQPLTYPKEGKVDMRNLKKYIRMLTRGEDERLKMLVKNPPKLGFKTLENSSKSYFQNDRMVIQLDKKEFQNNWYTKVFSPPLDQLDMAFQLPESTYLKLFEPDKNRIGALIKDYISGFLWTYLYYKKGTSAVNPNYCYVSAYAPLIQDVSEMFPKEVLEPSNKIKKSYALPVLKQLLAVLPPQSIKIVPKDLHPFYQLDSPIIDMLPIKVSVDTDGKDLERLGVVRMPSVEPIRLLQLDLNISSEKLKMYEDQKNILFEQRKEKYIDRNLIPKKLILETEVRQDDLSIPEKMVNLDAVISVNLEMKQLSPSIHTVVVQPKEKYEKEDVVPEPSVPVPVPAPVPVSSAPSVSGPISAPNVVKDFRKQLMMLKQIKK